MDKKGTKIKISPDLLPKKSSVREKRICDCNGEIYEKTHQEMEKAFEREGKDICPQCMKKITQERREATNLKKYRVRTPNENEQIKQKTKENNIKKYGCPSTSQVKEVREKQIKTLQEHYGVDNPLKSEEIKEKVIATCIEKYGVSNPVKAKEIQDKIEQTNIERYGCKSTAMIPEIREKMRKSLYQNGTIATSKPQLSLLEMVQTMDIKDVDKIYSNYPASYFNLDIVVVFSNGVKIDIEYDGWYWHSKQGQINKDKNRDKLLGREGYKILRVKGGSSLPEQSALEEKILQLKESDKQYEELKLPEWIKNEKGNAS